MKRFLWLIFLVVVMVAAAPGWAQKPLPGQASSIELVEWMFQRPLTCVEIQILSQQKGGESWGKIAQGLDHPTDEERTSLLSRFRSDSQPFATTACQLDKTARREISPGLQFQDSEAFAEWLLFGMAIVSGEDATQVLPGPNFRKAVQATLSGLWPTLSDHYKEVLTGFPVYWANMRKQWNGMSLDRKNATVIGWQNNLANAFQKEDYIRLASACLQDLQEVMGKNPTPQALQIACDRLDFAARRLRQPDLQDSSLADELSQFAARARQQQASDAESAALLKKMNIPKVWYSPIWTDALNFPGYYPGGAWASGWGTGYPYRW